MIKKIKKLPNGSKKLFLSGGGWAIVDAGRDFERARKYTWHKAHQCGDLFYACTYLEDGRRVYLHAFLMGEPPAPGLVRDHQNLDGLDCRRANMRWATHRQNSINRACTSASGFYGVTPHPSGKFQWYALGKTRGTEASAEAAALARDAFIRENAPREDLPFFNFNFDQHGRRVVIIQYDHGLPEFQPHEKQVPVVGVAEDKADKHGPWYKVQLVYKGDPRRARYRDPIQGGRQYDEWRAEVGLPRVNNPDASPVVVSLGISYGIGTR